MDLILAALVGIGIGVITGITPGIHVNLVCTLLLAAFPFLPFSGLDAVIFIIALAITHSFLDIIPSIYLGAPDSATALGVLPGHRYLLSGNGFMAVKLSSLGALAGMLFGLASFALFSRLTVFLETVPKQIIGYALAGVPVIMWLRDKKKLAAGTIILVASAYGFIGFRLQDPLFPMLSGLFGASTLLYSLNEGTDIPTQQLLPYIKVRWKHFLQASIGGVISGGLTAILPGFGAAHAAVIGMLFAIGTGDHGFLIMTGTIGTTNFFLSLAAYNAIGKARNGALIAASTVHPNIPLLAAIGASLFAAGCGAIFTLLLGRVATRWITKLPYKATSIGVLCFVTTLVVLLTGWIGLVAYITGASIGLLAATSKSARAHAMSCILIPVAWRFIMG